MKSLKQLRKAKRLTQQELSKLTGVHRQLVSRAESGRIKPSPSTKRRIESVLGPVDWMEGRTVKTRSPNYQEAERLVERLVETTATMDGEERETVRQLILKYYNKKMEEM